MTTSVPFVAAGAALGIVVLSLRQHQRERRMGDTKKEPHVPRFRLFYWPMAGRGEFIRLVFVETDTAYTDEYSKLSWAEAQKKCYGNPKHFAVPALEDKDVQDEKGCPLVFSQTPVILQYLAGKCAGGRLLPRTEALRVKAAVLCQDAMDVATESCAAWHAVHFNKSWTEQREGTQPHVDFFLCNRVPKWLAHFDRALARNSRNADIAQLAGADMQLYFVGDALSYADLAVFNILNGLRTGRSPLGESALVFDALATPLLKQFVAQILSRPRIRSWYQSPDRHEYGDGSPVF